MFFFTFIFFEYIPWSIYLIPYYILHIFVVTTGTMGIWVAAHECGHFSFSDNKLICDLIGLVLHSIVLTPYYAW